MTQPTLDISSLFGGNQVMVRFVNEVTEATLEVGPFLLISKHLGAYPNAHKVTISPSSITSVEESDRVLVKQLQALSPKPRKRIATLERLQESSVRKAAVAPSSLLLGLLNKRN